MAWVNGVHPVELVHKDCPGERFLVEWVPYNSKQVLRGRSLSDGRLVPTLTTKNKNGVNYTYLRPNQQIDTRVDRKRVHVGVRDRRLPSPVKRARKEARQIETESKKLKTNSDLLSAENEKLRATLGEKASMSIRGSRKLGTHAICTENEKGVVTVTASVDKRKLKSIAKRMNFSTDGNNWYINFVYLVIF